MVQMHLNKSVLVTARFFDGAAQEALHEAGFKVLRAGLAHDAIDNTISSAMQADLTRCSGWIMGIPPVSRQLLEQYPGLHALARRGVGYDTIDTQAVQDLGRVLTVTPGANEPSVADHTVGLMLAVVKRLHESHAQLQAGNSKVLIGHELFAKTVGLVGLGRISRLVAKRLRGFDVRLLVYDPYASASTAAELGATLVPLEHLLANSDIVSLHAPLNEHTHHLMNAQAIRSMKQGAYLINTSRGGLVDDTALLAALKSGHLGGAGLDVFESEHNAALAGVSQELLALPTTVCTPHAAGSSAEGLARANMLAAQCLIAALNNTPIPPECIVADGRAA